MEERKGEMEERKGEKPFKNVKYSRNTLFL
jgi:hypothetical protein